MKANSAAFLFLLLLITGAYATLASADTIQQSTYTYDTLNRLKSVQYEDGTVITYTYDQAGNRLTKSTGALSVGNPTITAIAAGGGKLTPSGTITIPTGQSRAFIIETGSKATASDCLPGYSFSPLQSQCQKPLGTPPDCPRGIIDTSQNLCYYKIGNTLYHLLIDGKDAMPLTPVLGPFGLTYTYTLDNIQADHIIYAIFEANDPTACTSFPATIGGTDYYSLQAAYNSASDGSIIKISMDDNIGTLYLNRDVSVTLDGGYNCYSNTPGNYTIKGDMVVAKGIITFTGGTLIIT
ncbi:MAG: RHS repeat protein, partial [Desulfuromonadales bacterium]|nr:RHS repeat protein [Desulfuromonadales bacterium]